MKHKMSIRVSREKEDTPVVLCEKRSIRERILHFLFGDLRNITVLVLGDSVNEVSLEEVGDERVT